MAYVPGYDYDIFVSYGRVDDERPHEDIAGWVSTLVRTMRTRLSQGFGREENYSLCFDLSDIRGHHSLSPEIFGKVKKSAIFLLVMSPGWLKSKWCQDEFATFSGQFA